MRKNQLQEAARRLTEAERDRQPVKPLTQTYDGLDIPAAYEVQRMVIADRIANGAKVRGHKVGLTAGVMREQFGVSEPDYGVLLDDMFLLEGTEIPAGSLLAPRVEPELAFVLDRPLSGPGVTVADVLRATAFVVPSLEIIDSRIQNWEITVYDSIADNASSARVVLGGTATHISDIDPRLLGVVLRRNGEIAETGATGAALGNPVSAVAWLANKLGEFDVTLEEGAVVLPGSCTRALPVSPGDHVRADFGQIGSVGVVFA
ncbi:2-keto-4-pentenoate hydratase [Streptomyces cylindrosporus]|uniref:Fumarylacetoacetate hydrolase family protein n=1 Tax=Streptomyces cylindrosporus TaxID=2927583 RepID=A0ABS9Y844_9ACTN|nr:fumarylacetoacetate hydrolase family protein [Streptomyces cylindrosporus]MCI3273390.1 fumarylacetoacetate hydrolase family protein [Streptomyces cylindrosporus]